MKKKISKILLSLFLLLYPIITVIGFNFNDIKCFLAININITLIDRFLFSICENIYDGIFYLIIGALKVMLFTVLPIILLIKYKKGLYILEFVVLFVDTICMMGLPEVGYHIFFINFLFHFLSLFLVWKAIKSFDEY